ncbi:hypothetical protein BDA96_04G063000 [Sorghum bicolor]|uniref:Uncharacterized protein n=1 Tax=Sorghum bicolor TaxID=4558 RepID=A0A921R0Y4_SORBI|nr:hypothetical protein BDA96_04G063000 [Sorghum bicolor]
MIWVTHRRKIRHAKFHFSNSRERKKRRALHLVLPPRMDAPPPLRSPYSSGEPFYLPPPPPLHLPRTTLRSRRPWPPSSCISSRPLDPGDGDHQISTTTAPKVAHGGGHGSPELALGGGSSVLSPSSTSSTPPLETSKIWVVGDLPCRTRLTAGRAPPRRLLWAHHYGVAEICVFSLEDAYLRSRWPRTQNECLGELNKTLASFFFRAVQFCKERRSSRAGARSVHGCGGWAGRHHGTPSSSQSPKDEMHPRREHKRKIDSL